MKGLAIATAILTLALVGCEAKQEHPPTRPKNVPADATWAGGYDGGYFFACKSSKVDLECRIYNDKTGDLEVNGVFEHYANFRVEDISSFDGHYLNFANGKSVQLKEHQ